MGCTGCSTTMTSGTAKGCQNNGGCSTGGCNKLNTYDWLSSMEMHDVDEFNIVEVSFKNGTRKDFYKNEHPGRIDTGDMVVVQTDSGYDIGQVSLSGELVRLQIRKKRVKDNYVYHPVVRQANKRDLERLQEARELERSTMIRSRAIARSLGLEMKIGDVEYQGDKRKATFYYTADGRVDFRELIRHYAREFRIKVEMRQIGARQESGLIGGLGSCGRELCCSTWLTDFKSVSTSAARYQNLAINQSKLSGQCGRLKCCLNYELDNYIDALKYFPKNADYLLTEAGKAVLIKTDIFKRVMYYAYERSTGRSQVYALEVDTVKEILELNKNNKKPADLMLRLSKFSDQSAEPDYEDVTGFIELPEEERKKGGRKKRRKGKKGGNKNKNKQ